MSRVVHEMTGFCAFVRMPKTKCRACTKGLRPRYGFATFLNRFRVEERQQWMSLVGDEPCVPCGGRGWLWANACAFVNDFCMTAKMWAGHLRIVEIGDRDVPL